MSPKIVKKFQFCTLCRLKLSKSFTVGQKKAKINFGTTVSTNIVKKFRFCAQWAQKMKFGPTVSTNIVKKFRKMNLAIFHGVCPWLVGIGSAPATTHLFLPVLKIARNWEQQPLQNIMEGEEKSCVRRSSVVVVCNCSPDSDGESAGLAAKAASSKIYSHSTLSYSFKLGFVLRCDKHLRLSERCSLPDRQSRWLLDICSRCRRTN